MLETLTSLFGLLAAGGAFGALRNPNAPRKAKPRGTGWILVVMVGGPAALLMLANLFNSDVLGWMFGLSLMLGLALIPCGVIFFIGMRIGARFNRHTA